MKKFVRNCIIILCYSVVSTIGTVVACGAIGAFMTKRERIEQDRMNKILDEQGV